MQGVIVGALAGLVSVLFRIVIEHANDLLFFVLDYGNQLVMVKIAWFAAIAILALLVARLVRWQPMISGSGIPQVEGELHGVFSQNWWKVLIAKFVGGALAIGAGLSLRREGPSIQLGAMAGKGFSRISKRIKIEEKLLMTCGACAGVAAAFNAPFAGVLFSLEELHKSFSVEVLLSTMAASVTCYFCRIYLESSRWIRRVENASAIAEFNVPSAPALARHTDQAEALLNGIRTFCALVAIGAWGISTQWTSCAAALTLASICCVLYSVSASPFRSLTLLMQTLVLLSLFSFVVKFGLMVQITDLWQFLLFLFPLLTTMQLLKLQWPKFAGLWGQLIVFMGSFISVTNPPVYDYAAFFNDNLSKIVGVGFAWLAFAVLSPGSDARKGRRHIRALRRNFVDQLSRHPQHSEHEFESLVYHHVSQLSQSQDALARRWLLRWGVVLLNCSHVVWQLREWETRSDPLAQVRDLCINLLRDVMSERGVQQRPLASTLRELLRICEVLNHHHQPAARELAAAIWRLYCALSQLEQAPVAGTIGEKIT